MNARTRPYGTDLVVLLATALVVALVFGIADIAGGAPEWWERGTSGKPSTSPQDGMPDDQAVYEEREETIFQGAGATQEGQTTRVPLLFEAVNVTRVEVVLTWQDDIGNSNDLFELGVEKDGETLQTFSSTSGAIDIVFQDPGPGNYTVLVTALDCPGQVGMIPVDRDSGNDWDLRATALRRVVVP